MLKIVVFDSGYGGEFFADRLKETLPVVDIIRIIDWRNADKIISSSKLAREIAEKAIEPYIGKADLIIFANFLITITSLRYFMKKYKNQKFIGLDFQRPDTFINYDTLILTTKAVTKTLSYKSFLFHLKRNTKTLSLDSWPIKIDDGELLEDEIVETLKINLLDQKIEPREIILGCSQFYDIETPLKKFFGQNIKIYDSFDQTIREICKLLKVKGSLRKQKY